MKPIKIYVSEFKGINCREYLPSAHLSYEDADKEDCDITVINGLIPDDWVICESNYGGLCLYDKAGEYLPLSVNINHNSSIILDRVSSVSVIKNNSHTVIARKNKPLFVAVNGSIFVHDGVKNYELYQVLATSLLASQVANKLNELEL